jgi:AraC-like DNA-binding protein
MGDMPPDRIFFTTDALPERDRFPAFCEEILRRWLGCDIEDHGLMPFRGMLEIRRAGAVGVADIFMSAADIIRNARHTRDGSDDIFVQLWQQGAAHATHGRREGLIKAHEGIILDNTDTGRQFLEDASRVWVLRIPRGRIASLAPNVVRLAGTKLTDNPSLQLLFGYLEGTRSLDLGSNPAAVLFGDHLVDLVALALGGGGEARELEAQSGVRAARSAAILRAISNQIADRNLSAATIAAQMGLTPRYVHLLLEQSGQTFTQHVLRRRLEKAAELLRGDGGRDRKIVDIALESGFSDLSHFNRTFRRHFDDTPSSMRAIRRKRPAGRSNE